MLWGHKYTSIPNISHVRRLGGHPTEYSTKRYSKRDMFPRSSNVRIHNTVADATLVNNPKVNSTIEYNHACMRRPSKRRHVRDGRCTQKFGRATKGCIKRPRRYKHDSDESSIHKSQQGGGNITLNIPLNSERDCRNLQCTC